MYIFPISLAKPTVRFTSISVKFFLNFWFSALVSILKKFRDPPIRYLKVAAKKQQVY